MKILRLLLFNLLIHSTIALGQELITPFPKVGDKIPQHTFYKVKNFNSDTLNTNARERKWLVIDFWTRYCSGCIKSFPKMDSLHNQFKSKVDIVMVGVHESKDQGYQATKAIIEEKISKLNLTFPFAFDSLSTKKFSIRAVPYILVVDPSGIVVAKAISIDSSQLELMINNKKTGYNYAFSKGEKKPSDNYDFRKPALTSGTIANGGYDTAFIFRSLLTKATQEMPTYVFTGFRPKDERRTSEIIGITPYKLIKFANAGAPDWSPTDSINSNIYPSIFYDTTNKKLKNLLKSSSLYTYSLTLPNPNTLLKKKLEILSLSIEQAWGITLRTEKRRVPVYQVIVTDKNKVSTHKSKTGKPSFKEINVSDGFISTAISIEKFIALTKLYKLLGRLEKSENLLPVINMTEISYLLDVKFLANLDDYASVKKAMNTIGLDIVRGEKEMNCVVVTETR